MLVLERSMPEATRRSGTCPSPGPGGAGKRPASRSMQLGAKNPLDSLNCQLPASRFLRPPPAVVRVPGLEPDGRCGPSHARMVEAPVLEPPVHGRALQNARWRQNMPARRLDAALLKRLDGPAGPKEPPPPVARPDLQGRDDLAMRDQVLLRDAARLSPVRSQPAAFSASCCRSRFRSSFDTRAQPMSMRDQPDNPITTDEAIRCFPDAVNGQGSTERSVPGSRRDKPSSNGPFAGRPRSQTMRIQPYNCKSLHLT